MKRTISILLALAMFLLLIAMLFGSLQSILNDEDWFFEEYRKLDQGSYMGMSTEDLVAATMSMIHYMQGKIDSIDLMVTVDGEQVSMFNDRERAHMVDVRALYLGWQTFQIIALVAAVIILVLAFLVLKKDALLPLCRGFLWGSALLLLIVAALGIWVVLDFNAFWTAFHHLFFTNDLWMLDPLTSRMINMMPGELFYDIVVLIVVRFILPWVLLVIAAFTGKHFLKKKEKQKA